MKKEEQIHKWKMEEIEARRKAEIEVENLKFDHQLQLQREIYLGRRNTNEETHLSSLWSQNDQSFSSLDKWVLFL
jgi:hypothetical protein